MKNPNAALIVSLLLLSLGAGLMLIGIYWLIPTGLALMMYAQIIPARRQLTSVNRNGVFMCLAIGGLCLLYAAWSGNAFGSQPQSWWYVASVAAIWLWWVILACHHWQMTRRPRMFQ